MAGEMLLITNPKKRRKARAGAKKRVRTKRRVAKRRVAVTVKAAANPIRRRRRGARSNPIKRRRRSNPISRRGLISQLTGAVMPAVQGALGAVAVNAVFNRLPLPVMLKTGIVGTMTKAVMAVGVGMLVGKFAGQSLGRNMASGALTVLAYNQIQPMLPAGLSDMGYYGAGYALDDLPNSLSDLPNSLSEYISDTSMYEDNASERIGEYIS